MIPSADKVAIKLIYCCWAGRPIGFELSWPLRWHRNINWNCRDLHAVCWSKFIRPTISKGKNKGPHVQHWLPAELPAFRSKLSETSFFFFWQASGNTKTLSPIGDCQVVTTPPTNPSVIHLISLSNGLLFICKNKIKKDLSVPHIIVGMDPLLISGFESVHIQGMLNYLIGLLCGLAD